MASPLLSKPGAARTTRRTERSETVAGDTRLPRAAPGPLASFARFVVCGGGVGLVSSPAVAVLALLMPWALANALITVASTLLCTELHARFTFGTGRRAGGREHWQSAGSATAAFAVTSAAMLVLHAVRPFPGVWWEQVVFLSASGLAGIGRFLVLRLFVFAGWKRTAAPTKAQAQVVEVTGSVSSSVHCGRYEHYVQPLDARSTLRESPLGVTAGRVSPYSIRNAILLSWLTTTPISHPATAPAAASPSP